MLRVSSAAFSILCPSSCLFTFYTLSVGAGFFLFFLRSCRLIAKSFGSSLKMPVVRHGSGVRSLINRDRGMRPGCGPTFEKPSLWPSTSPPSCQNAKAAAAASFRLLCFEENVSFCSGRVKSHVGESFCKCHLVKTSRRTALFLLSPSALCCLLPLFRKTFFF